MYLWPVGRDREARLGGGEYKDQRDQEVKRLQLDHLKILDQVSEDLHRVRGLYHARSE